MTIRWECKPFDALSLTELYTALALRQRVFVVEQACPYLDSDGADLTAHHLLGFVDDALIASARLLGPGTKYPNPSIGRVVTAPETRGQGHGKALMAKAVEEIERLYPGHPITIGAQAYLEEFYRGFGFHRDGGDYLEDGIPHLEMTRPSPARLANR